MRTTRGMVAALVAALAAFGATNVEAQSIAVGNVNDFEDGTTQGWLNNLLGMGGGVPGPEVVPTGGPGGAGDAYLQITAHGRPGPGGRLTALNLSPTWTGNYLAAGVAAISLDANNFGPSDLSLRLLFENPMGGPPTDIAVSFIPLSLPAGSGWRSLVFPLFGPGGLAVIAPGMNLTTLLTNTTAIRIVHDPAIGFPPPQVDAVLGIDNITAVPEPSTFLLVGAGLVAAAAVRRRRRA